MLQICLLKLITLFSNVQTMKKDIPINNSNADIPYVFLVKCKIQQLETQVKTPPPLNHYVTENFQNGFNKQTKLARSQ